MYTVFKFPTLLLFCLPILVFNSCEEEKKDAEIDYAAFSEQEKRKPENALASMDIAEGLQMELFASEPMVTNPTNMAIDAKGRIWVCEGRNYRLFANPNNTYDDKGDRILIIEDTDGDGVADSSKVFYQGQDINSALGIAVLGNKIIVSVSPNVFVFTDEDGDDIPDSKEILFTGIEGVDHDHGVHAFVFGPDGKLYFNFGNNGGQLKDKNGNIVNDIHGRAITNEGKPFREGMAFRTNWDGSRVEVLGDNFRNPFELTIDSYGGLWQSDNDDDGNRGVRINFLMEHGNYGYKNALTGQSWRERRTGWNVEIPKRHWHLNDPGTVPNLLQTGSGSPCGIIIYEGDLLPEKYQNQLIHAEPGHNVVRSYFVSEKGAGYEAKIQNMVKSQDDWFRPDDVTVAPDGSLFISDWYDGGVGGHKAEDISRGRIYHLSTKEGYQPEKFDFSTGEGAAVGLLSDNMDVFYQSWQKIHAMGQSSEPILKELMAKGGTAKARALWLGANIPAKASVYIEMALADDDIKFRVQGIRMAKFAAEGTSLETYLEKMVNDPSPQVRREVALALAFLGTPKAAELWSVLAQQHEAGDRWYLEALGIAADQYPDLYFGAWKKKMGNDWMDAGGKDIVWRVRASESVPMLAEIIKNGNVPDERLPSYFRAFSFKEHPKKNALLMNFLTMDHPAGAQLKALAVGQLDGDFVINSKKNIQTVKSVLPQIEGTPEWLMTIKNLKLYDQNQALFKVLLKSSVAGELRKEAAGVLFDFGGKPLVQAYLESEAPESNKMQILGLLGSIKNTDAVDVLTESLFSQKLSLPLKRNIVEGLGNTSDGQHKLYDFLKENKLDSAYRKTAVLKLMGSRDSLIRHSAPSFLKNDSVGNLNIDVLVERTGNSDKGKEVYNMYCSACHVADGNGVEFGPTLSDIGSKLSKNFLYSNIVDPSAGISFGYEGYTVKMKDGKTYTGYILSRTEDELTLKMMGGTQVAVELTDIDALTAMDKSLMTEGLHKIMNEEELVDLVEYLTTLITKG
ncbi:PVC-type heme-binding CxxCH protein [uncultured Kriegella sp.]|uniref:PVC-type heme-binding CxxCH protein n=1 Tax=uncultured Kriegella sp. TaxID=1798910 RepID=UPI0030DC5000|tara:strand:+ start:41249 stop:44302 length:3054 start_codon:yes stop_codon:yes gene_type:complete